MPAQTPVSRAAVAGIVLAAGRSARMGPERNKLVEPIAGRPLVAWPVDALLEAGVDPVVVVTGFEADRIQAALGERPCRFVHHEQWPEGMGSSLAQGMEEILTLSPPPDAVLVCVGDLPSLNAAAVTQVVDAARGDGEIVRSIDPDSIVLPVHRGHRGHPVLFGARYFGELAGLVGDEGGRAILERNRSTLRCVEFADEMILQDIDTPAELEAARRGIGRTRGTWHEGR